MLILLACTIFFYRLGESEYGAGYLIGGISLALSLASIYLFHLGWLGCLLVQGGLVAVLTLWNLAFKKPGNG